MKVLFLIDSLEGYGAEKSIVQIALAMQTVTPVFIHLYPGEKLKLKLETNGIKVYSLNINSVYNLQEPIQLIKPILESEKPDIIHSTLFRADRIARKLKIFFPEIVLIGSFVSNSYGFNRYRQLGLLAKIKLFTTQLKDKATAHRVDYFICNSNAIKNSNIRALGISDQSVKVIYRGRNFEDQNNSFNYSDNIRQELSLKNQTVFLNVSRLNKGKGQLDLLEAFAKLLKVNSNIVLLIAGEGSFREILEAKISSLNLGAHVYLLGYREDVSNLLKFANYFVFPTYYEGLPGALIEAIISKTPIIVSDIPENIECLANDGALFFKPGNVSGLFHKLKEALVLETWPTKTQNSFDYAKENFEIKKVSKNYEEFYNEIISKKVQG